VGPAFLHHEHLVTLYESDDALVARVAEFLAPAVRDGEMAVVVATAAHRAAFRAALAAEGADLERAEASGRFPQLDAAETLATFMVDGAPDPARFREKVGGLISRAAADGRHVRVYGEMVALLWDAGDVASAIALEDLWNALAVGHEFALLCAYPTSLFTAGGGEPEFTVMCGQHTAVVSTEAP
jgi:hypothetical protein